MMRSQMDIHSQQLTDKLALKSIASNYKITTDNYLPFAESPLSVFNAESIVSLCAEFPGLRFASLCCFKA